MISNILNRHGIQERDVGQAGTAPESKSNRVCSKYVRADGYVSYACISPTFAEMNKFLHWNDGYKNLVIIYINFDFGQLLLKKRM